MLESRILELRKYKEEIYAQYASQLLVEVITGNEDALQDKGILETTEEQLKLLEHDYRVVMDFVRCMYVKFYAYLVDC